MINEFVSLFFLFGASISPYPEWNDSLIFPGDLDNDGSADLNGDGKADVCARGIAGVWCALSTVGSSSLISFGPMTLWSSVFSDAGGWRNNARNATIHYPDLNHDGRADICGRGPGGIWCAISN